MIDLTGKIALVTGASRGIGYSAALGLAKAGAHIVALARTTGGLQDLDDEIFKATNAHATLVPVDVTDYDALDRLGAALFERYGRLDILLANAGAIHALMPLGHLRPKDFDKIIATNLTANWRLLRAMGPLLRAAGSAGVFVISDAQAQNPSAFYSAYAASKAGLEALAKSYAAEMAHTNIMVEIIDPGPTDTSLRRQVFPGTDGEKKPSEQLLMPYLLTLAERELRTRHA